MKIDLDFAIECPKDNDGGCDVFACTREIISKLGHGPAFKLMAGHKADIVHGHVTITHNQPPQAHQIKVTLYESDRNPDPSNIPKHRRQLTTLRRASTLPDKAELQRRLTRGADGN